MEITELKISQEDFESAVPAATTKNSDVFEILTSSIEQYAQWMIDVILGEKGKEVCLSGKEPLSKFAKDLACKFAFQNNMRSLDLVLTATGFGVVNTQDTAPASQARVDALEEELKVNILRMKDLLLTELTQVDGWGDEECAQLQIDTVFYRYAYFLMYTGMKGTSGDWSSAHPYILNADSFLRSKISNKQMDSLLNDIRKNSLNDARKQAVLKMRRIIGLEISGQRNGNAPYLDLMNFLEDHPEDFSEYMNSNAYKTNHYEPYENNKDSSVFFFQG
ncbi:MAG: hypothetical protein LKE54_04435 [Prevotella sp.]|jgi:hypothetical protein|nr:hypothetical protein [Prevotella sp.]